MKFIYFNEANEIGEIAVLAQREAVFLGPRLVATCEDFDLEETLTRLGDKLDTSSGGFLVATLDEYRTDSEVTKVES